MGGEESRARPEGSPAKRVQIFADSPQKHEPTRNRSSKQGELEKTAHKPGNNEDRHKEGTNVSENQQLNIQRRISEGIMNLVRGPAESRVIDNGFNSVTPLHQEQVFKPLPPICNPCSVIVRTLPRVVPDYAQNLQH